MLFKFLNRHQYAPAIGYFIILAVMLAALSYLFHLQVTCENCSIASINPSAYLMPIIAYISIGLVGVTIGFTRKTASEKNALDFAKELGLLGLHMRTMAELRKELLLKNGNLNRRTASAYMESLSDLAEPKTAEVVKPKVDAAKEEPDDTKEKHSDAPNSADSVVTEEKPEPIPTTEVDWKNRKSAFALLNALESCANAIRYGIYDEDFIYNIYGSHFIEWYELTYGLIKTRQLKQERIWINFEWLAVKWTLRRNITGVISAESLETSYIINEALAGLKSHKKTRPIKSELERLESKLERRKFPM